MGAPSGFYGNHGALRWFALSRPLLACLVLPGCFHAESLVAQARAAADHSREEVVDLGKYLVSLPRAVDATTTVSVQIHVFANVTKPDVSRLTEALDEFQSSLRHQTILAIRKTAPHDLADPRLTVLRDRVEEVTKRVLNDVPIASVGFRQFSVFEM